VYGDLFAYFCIAFTGAYFLVSMTKFPEEES
jgi:hypothetical protein